jgi:peptidoglycan/xylan/chitin deacetylase (PgdA/CDA1 family)
MSVAGSLRSRVPEPVKDAGRLSAAQRLERRLRASSAVRAAALVLHAVAPEPGASDLEVDPAMSVAQLDLLVGYLSRRYALVRAGELLAAARDRAPGDRIPVAITFDDDLRSHAEHASPVLTRHGAVATAFLCGARDPFWWQALQCAVDAHAVEPADLPQIDSALVRDALARRPKAIARLAKAIEDLDAASRDQLARRLRDAAPSAATPLEPAAARALATLGWELGFHTQRHDMLVALTDDELGRALTAGRDEIPGGPPRTLAYPHGKAGGREAAAARSAGYVAAFTGRAEVITESTDPHLVGRLQPNVRSVGRLALHLARALADV